MIVGYAQTAPRFGEVEANLRSAERMITAADGADLIVLPELALTGYDFKDKYELDELAEPFSEGATGRFIRQLAADLHVTLVIGYPERYGNRFYNACMIAMPDGRIENYRKIHLFSREKELFEPGNAPPPVVDTPAGRIGLMICFDWFFPETARMLALAGAQIIAHPSNLVLSFCQRAMFARSVENGVFSITANRIGTEERAARSLTFTGASQVVDPKGNTLISAPVNEEHLGLTEIDPALADNKQVSHHNHLLGDRRIDLYGSLLATEMDASSRGSR